MCTRRGSARCRAAQITATGDEDRDRPPSGPDDEKSRDSVRDPFDPGRGGFYSPAPAQDGRIGRRSRRDRAQPLGHGDLSRSRSPPPSPSSSSRAGRVRVAARATDVWRSPAHSSSPPESPTRRHPSHRHISVRAIAVLRVTHTSPSESPSSESESPTLRWPSQSLESARAPGLGGAGPHTRQRAAAGAAPRAAAACFTASPAASVSQARGRPAGIADALGLACGADTVTELTVQTEF